MADTTPVATDFSALARLRTAAASNSPEALKQAARQFEALFTQMMLKSMRAVSFGDDLTGEQGGLYKDMLDQQMSLHLSQGKGLGLANMLVEQMQRAALKGGQAGATDPAKAADTTGMSTSALHSALPLSAKAAGGATWARTPQDFVRAVWPHAQSAARELGVSPRVLVAQAALETGWGKHLARNADGSTSNNFFGIKAGGGWDGTAAAGQGTTEYVNGAAQSQDADFRAYGSPAESFRDFVRFIRDNPRYAEALRHGGDDVRFTEGLQRAGYATDPSYSDKVQKIARGLIET